MMIIIAKVALGLAIVIFMMRRYPKAFDFNFFKFWRWHLPNWKMVKRILLVGIPLLVLCLFVLPSTDIFTWQVGETVGQQVFTEEHPQVQLVQISPWLLFGVVTILPIFEEWLFRRSIQEALKKDYGAVKAILIGATLFAVFHALNPGASWLMFFTPFVAGIVLGAAYHFQGIQSACGIHMGYNGVIVLGWLV